MDTNEGGGGIMRPERKLEPTTDQEGLKRRQMHYREKRKKGRDTKRDE
jgi:hypothetical protein